MPATTDWFIKLLSAWLPGCKRVPNGPQFFPVRIIPWMHTIPPLAASDDSIHCLTDFLQQPWNHGTQLLSLRILYVKPKIEFFLPPPWRNSDRVPREKSPGTCSHTTEPTNYWFNFINNRLKGYCILCLWWVMSDVQIYIGAFWILSRIQFFTAVLVFLIHFLLVVIFHSFGHFLIFADNHVRHFFNIILYTSLCLISTTDIRLLSLFASNKIYFLNYHLHDKNVKQYMQFHCLSAQSDDCGSKNEQCTLQLVHMNSLEQSMQLQLSLTTVQETVYFLINQGFTNFTKHLFQSYFYKMLINMIHFFYDLFTNPLLLLYSWYWFFIGGKGFLQNWCRSRLKRLTD